MRPKTIALLTLAAATVVVAYSALILTPYGYAIATIILWTTVATTAYTNWHTKRHTRQVQDEIRRKAASLRDSRP